MGGEPGEQVSLLSACQHSGEVRCKNVGLNTECSLTEEVTDFRDYQEDGETKTETTYNYSEFI